MPFCKGSKPLCCPKTQHCGTCAWTDAVSSWLSKVGLQSFIEETYGSRDGRHSWIKVWECLANFHTMGVLCEKPSEIRYLAGHWNENARLTDHWSAWFLSLNLYRPFRVMSSLRFQLHAATRLRPAAVCLICAVVHWKLGYRFKPFVSIFTVYIYSSTMLFCWDSGMLWNQPR